MFDKIIRFSRSRPRPRLHTSKTSVVGNSVLFETGCRTHSKELAIPLNHPARCRGHERLKSINTRLGSFASGRDAVRSTELNSIRTLHPSVHDSYKYLFSPYSSPPSLSPACSNPLRMNWFLLLPNLIRPSHSVHSMLLVLLPSLPNVTRSHIPALSTIRLLEDFAMSQNALRT